MADDKTSDFFAKQSEEAAQGATQSGEVQEEVQSDAPDKITVGEQEFTQDELQDMVGLKDKVSDIETQLGQSFDHVTKSWGDRGNRIAELEKQIADTGQAQIQQKAQTQGWDSLSPEEADKAAVAELSRLGIPTAEGLDNIVAEKVEAMRVIDNVDNFISQNQTAGKPEVTTEELLQSMDRTGQDHEQAYANMFPSQLKAWEEARVKQEAPTQGMVTEPASTAGAKQPQPSKVTADNLGEAIDKSLGVGGE